MKQHTEHSIWMAMNLAIGAGMAAAGYSWMALIFGVMAGIQFAAALDTYFHARD